MNINYNYKCKFMETAFSRTRDPPDNAEVAKSDAETMGSILSLMKNAALNGEDPFDIRDIGWVESFITLGRSDLAVLNELITDGSLYGEYLDEALYVVGEISKVTDYYIVLLTSYLHGYEEAISVLKDDSLMKSRIETAKKDFEKVLECSSRDEARANFALA